MPPCYGCQKTLIHKMSLPIIESILFSSSSEQGLDYWLVVSLMKSTFDFAQFNGFFQDSNVSCFDNGV